MTAPAPLRETADGAYPSPFAEADDALARQLQPSLYCQVTDGYVAFDHIARAWWIGNGPQPPDPEKARQAQRVGAYLEHLARKRFSDHHGQIVRDFSTAEPWAMCALTSDGRVHSVLNTTNAELVNYEAAIHQLSRDAHRTFSTTTLGESPAREPPSQNRRRNRLTWRERGARKAWNDLHEVGEMLYGVLARVMYTASVLERPETGHDAVEREKAAAMDSLRAEWAIVRASVVGMIQRQARFEYFEGVGLGAVIIIPALAFAGWMAASHGGDHFSDPAALTAAIIGGAAGAVISVTQRMTATQRTVGAQRSATNALVLDFAAPKYQKIALGALRPLVGAVFGAVLCFAVLGGLLAVEARSGQDDSVALAFFAVAGFAAGFSERFATDVLERATRVVSPPAREETEPNPASQG